MDGEPDKTLYRHYRIRTIVGQDDFAMLKEVFERRLTRDETRPDLIVIDGGKGQLGVFLKVLEDLGVPKIPIVSMAKAHGSKVDRFFLPGRKDAIRLPERSAGSEKPCSGSGMRRTALPSGITAGCAPNRLLRCLKVSLVSDRRRPGPCSCTPQP